MCLNLSSPAPDMNADQTGRRWTNGRQLRGLQWHGRPV